MSFFSGLEGGFRGIYGRVSPHPHPRSGIKGCLEADKRLKGWEPYRRERLTSVADRSPTSSG